MTEAKWRNGVTVVRAAALAAQRAPDGTGRVTAFDFAGSGGQRTWIGTVVLPPGSNTGPHHHGRHEVALCVVAGRTELRWGEQLEFVAELGPGDFAYFVPYVPHQERNLDAERTMTFLVVRSDNEKILVALDTAPVAQPEVAA
jgi:uncharacterized RmlC-like cupin family protein